MSKNIVPWGGGVYFLKSAGSSRFKERLTAPFGCLQPQEIGHQNEQCTQTCTAHFINVCSESLSLVPRAGTLLGQKSPCLLLGTYLLLAFCQSCSLQLFTGTHPVFRGIFQKPSVVLRVLAGELIRLDVAGLRGPVTLLLNHTGKIYTQTWQ